MKAESLQARDLDFDNFLASNFDDLQGFAWGPSASFPTARGPSGSLDTFPLPNSINEVRYQNVALDLPRRKSLSPLPALCKVILRE